MGPGTCRQDQEGLKHLNKKSPKRSSPVSYGCPSRPSTGNSAAPSSAIHPWDTRAKRHQIFLSACHRLEKAFLQQQRFGKQHPGMAEPPPHAETLHTTNSPALGPAESEVNSCYSQPGVPAPSNALSACENIHLE